MTTIAKCYKCGFNFSYTEEHLETTSRPQNCSNCGEAYLKTINLTEELYKEKHRVLLKLREEVKDCTLCTELCSTRHNTVFGEGNFNAKILFLGESPGQEEDLSGKPFVGKSGKLLDNILKACNIKREYVYICNILKCRPPGNRLPASQEISNCSKYLQKQIEVVNPEFIVCLGSVASQAIVGLNISRARGQWYKYKHHKVICTFHPSYLLRTPSAKELAWKDLQLLLQAMRK